MRQYKLDLKLQICKDHAISKNGICLSTEYVDYKTKMLWQCSEGHQWEACWNTIKNNNAWCIKCYQIKEATDISILQKYAISKNGLLISNQYINNHTKMLWQCSEGHRWEAIWSNIKFFNYWCPYCAGNGIPDIKELQDYALSKNGKLLSTEYINAHYNYIWECNNKHQWEANWNNIKTKNQWCPDCARFKTEKICRNILEEKLNYKLNKQRFYYDISNSKNFLEFDGYNAEYNIAFEFHGYQHYIYPNQYHKTKKQFLEAQLRDNFKEQFAAENDIKLLIIPYTKSNNLEEYIEELIKSV